MHDNDYTASLFRGTPSVVAVAWLNQQFVPRGAPRRRGSIRLVGRGLYDASFKRGRRAGEVEVIKSVRPDKTPTVNIENATINDPQHYVEQAATADPSKLPFLATGV